jgi:dienelactone hydrolase
MAAASAADRWLAKAELAPPFAAPPSAAAWAAERLRIRAKLWELLGRLPPRPARPAVETLGREDRGDFVAERFQFDNGAGDTVPGVLLLPKASGRRLPAILYGHWHAGQYDLGKEELFRAPHLPEAPGPALARRGYAVMAIDAPGFGERNGRGPDGPELRDSRGAESLGKCHLWVGRSPWGMLLRDDLMALDYLAARPEVDPDLIGATGISMGSTRTWWLMALDERIRTGVGVACLTRYQNLIRHGGLHQHGHYYFVPGLLNHFDAESVVALIAPRAVLFQTGDQDAGSPLDGVRAIEAAVRGVYRLWPRDDAFQSRVYPGVGHAYTAEMWAQTLAWFDRELRPRVGRL